MNEKYTHNILGSVFKDGELFALTQGEAQATKLCIELNALHEKNEQLKQDKKRLIGYLHRYGKVDVEDIDDIILNKEYFDEWGELYGGDVE